MQGALAFEEAHGAQPRPIDIYFLSGDPIANEACGYRRQQDAAAKMASGYQETFQIRGTDDREMIRRIRAQSSPRFFDAGAREAGNHADDFPKNQFHPTGGDLVIETGVLDGGPGDDAAVQLRDKILVLEPKDMLDRSRLASERDHLALGGRDRGIGSGAFDLPVTFPKRIAEKGEGVTSPEELMAAAHAACYAMALNATIGRKGASVSKTDVTATVTADKGEAGIKIVSSKLTVVAYGLQGIPKEQFADVAREAEGKCPVSNAYRASLQIEVDAKAV